VSRSVIGSGDVEISGFAFLKGETRTIAGERLLAKMLCKHHNTALSPLDAAAGHFYKVLSAFNERGLMRAQGARKRGGIDMYEVDGPLVERWMLKTVINLMFDTDDEVEYGWRPPEMWVRCAFGASVFPVKCGFYLLEGEGVSRISQHSTISILPRTRSARDGTLIGGQFRLANLQFVLAMEPLHISHQRCYRMPVIKDKPSVDLYQIIHIRW
jgi:hypothetical protein